LRIIKTKLDIIILRRAEVLPAALLAHVKDYFNQLSVELEEGCKEPIFSPSLVIRFTVLIVTASFRAILL
jgi:hypothetical protein